MKLAVTGKGGVGKSTIVAVMARILSQSGQKVLAVDADPDMNLAGILGVSESVRITPIIELKELIAERTGTEVGKPAPFFTMNPKVDDIPDTYTIEYEGIKLMTMGTVRGGGAGCACPENAFLKQLISQLVIARDEWVLLDMEAGIEHLGRGTAIGVDEMIIVVEASRSSMDTASRVKNLASQIGIKTVSLIGNRIRSEAEKEFIRKGSNSVPIHGFIDYSDQMLRINLGEASAVTIDGEPVDQVRSILDKILGNN